MKEYSEYGKIKTSFFILIQTFADENIDNNNKNIIILFLCSILMNKSIYQTLFFTRKFFQRKISVHINRKDSREIFLFKKKLSLT